MTSLLVELERIAHTFEIVSETRFCFLGRCYTAEAPLPSTGEASLGLAARKLLSDQLYLALHCRNPDVVSGTILPRHAAAHGRDFFSSLASCNRGTGSWRDGWTIHRVDDAHVAVKSHDVEVWASREEFRPDAGRLEVGATGRLCFPNEYRGMSRGYYVALGNSDAETGTNAIRVYWNVMTGGAEHLLSLITETLNAAGITFKFKSMGDPEGYDRTDAAVLYLPRGDWQNVSTLASSVYAEVRPWMRTNVSSYVFRLAPGLGLAEEPGGDFSFGEHRSTLIADALVSEHGSSDRFAAVRALIAGKGYDLERFHVNPGSTRQYEPI
jgi:hypothetical protein